MDYLRRDEESELDYIIRLVECKSNGTYDIDYTELFRLGFGVEFSSDHCRKLFYSIRMLIPYIDKEKLNSTSSASILKDFELKQQELYKEKVKLQDQRRELNKILREQSREEYFCDLIKNSIENSNLLPLEFSLNNIKKTDNDLLCFLNDLHYGLEQANYWNSYNPEIFKLYLKTYLSEILSIKNTHNSEKCVIFLGGDIISGLIHNLIRIENAENVVEQVQHVSEYISEFIHALSEEFTNIKIITVAGNHSRLMQNKKEDIKDEKLDLLVTWYMKARLSNLQNVEFIDNTIDTTIAKINIRGKLYYGVHGDLDSPNRVVDSLTQMLGEKPYAVLMAHRHHFEVNTYHDTKIITSGSFAGVDDYCITKRISGSPSQTICVCTDEGVKAIYDVVLN